MRRLARRLFTLCSAVSLGLCAAVHGGAVAPASDVAWKPGDPEFEPTTGIGSYEEMFEAIDRVDAEARGWLEGMEHHTGFREVRLEGTARKLWCFTASPEPLADVPPFTLSAAGRWESVVDDYRQMVRDVEEEGLAFEAFVRRNLRATVEAGAGPRASQARRVLYWWLRVERRGGGRRGPPVSFRAPVSVSAGHAGALHKLYVAWFDRNERRLTWDEDERRFTGRGDRHLDEFAPEGELRPMIAGEEAKDGKAPNPEPPGPHLLAGLPEDIPDAAPDHPAAPPVLYATHHERCEPLDAVQFRDALRAAAAMQPRGRPVWFIYVSHNYTSKEYNSRYLQGFVYYEPDRSGDRVRRGRVGTLTYESLGAYAQVSLPGTRFPATLDVPKVGGLPTPGAVDIDDADLAGVVDAARTKLGETDLQPILSVRRTDPNPFARKRRPADDGDDAFYVRFGWQPVQFDEGSIVKVQRTKRGFRAVGINGAGM